MDLAVIRMKELERKMQDREAERRKKEEEEEKKRKAEAAAKLQYLQENEKQRREEDNQVVGYVYNHSHKEGKSLANPVQLQQSGEQASSMDFWRNWNLTLLGGGRGAWIKYPNGSWGPVNKSFAFSASLYSNQGTSNFMPAEVWADLDLVYGLRRDNSRTILFFAFKHE